MNAAPGMMPWTHKSWEPMERGVKDALIPPVMICLDPTWHSTPCSHLACYSLFPPGMLRLVPTWHAKPYSYLACYALFPPGMYVGPGTAGNREEGHLVQLGKGVDHVGAEAGLQGTIRLTRILKLVWYKSTDMIISSILCKHFCNHRNRLWRKWEKKKNWSLFGCGVRGKICRIRPLAFPTKYIHMKRTTVYVP